VLRIGGVELRLLAKLAREAYERMMDTSLPEKLAAGNYWVVRRGAEKSALYGYNPLDLLEVPNELIPVLGRLPGQSAADVPDFIEQQTGLSVGPELVRQLVDFGVLRAAA
jgi:hypothetical protein